MNRSAVDSFAPGSSVLIAYVGQESWRATVIESNSSNPAFQTLTVRDSAGYEWGFFRHRQTWRSAFGRRKVLIGAVENVERREATA